MIDIQKKCLVIAGGNISISELKELSMDLFGLVICADSGVLLAANVNIIPDMVVGDFDSVDYLADSVGLAGSSQSWWMRYPAEKDDTDTLLCVKLGLRLGFKDFVIYGAFGGRMDHTIANIQTLAFLKKNKAFAILYSDDNQLSLLSSETAVFEYRNNWYISLFSFGDTCTGVCISGVKYPLSQATLNNTFPLGVSNEIVDDVCSVSVKTGLLLVVFSKK